MKSASRRPDASPRATSRPQASRIRSASAPLPAPPPLLATTSRPPVGVAAGRRGLGGARRLLRDEAGVVHRDPDRGRAGEVLVERRERRIGVHEQGVEAVVERRRDARGPRARRHVLVARLAQDVAQRAHEAAAGLARRAARSAASISGSSSHLLNG